VSHLCKIITILILIFNISNIFRNIISIIHSLTIFIIDL
jgi:hypothetical protein